MRMLNWLAAAIAAGMLSAAPAAADTGIGKKVVIPLGSVPGQVIYCDDGSGNAVQCSFGSGGGGGAGGDPSSTQTDGAAPTNSKVSLVGGWDGTNVRRLLTDALGRAFVNVYSLPSLPAGSAYVGNFGAQCVVVSGNQAYTVGANAPCNLTSTGRIKVGVSSAGNIDPAAQLTTTLSADVMGCKSYGTRPVWADGYTGALQCDFGGSLYVNSVAAGAATEATLAAINGKTPALGPQTGALSSPVVLSTDGPIGQRADAPATTTDTTPTSLIAQTKQLVNRVNALMTALGSPLQAGGTIGNTGFAVTNTPSIANTGFNINAGGVGGSSGNPLYTTATGGATGAVNSPAPTNASQMGGRDNGGNLQAVRTDGRGGLVPAQGVVATTRTTLTASTATPLEASAVTGRILESFFTEGSLTAPVYLCSTQGTACSSTNYDHLIPSGAGAGTVFTPPFAGIGRLYAYSTGTPTIVLNSWTAQ